MLHAFIAERIAREHALDRSLQRFTISLDRNDILEHALTIRAGITAVAMICFLRHFFVGNVESADVGDAYGDLSNSILFYCCCVFAKQKLRRF